jgi:5-methylcytosine-specific restriction endonuclease McrA
LDEPRPRHVEKAARSPETAARRPEKVAQPVETAPRTAAEPVRYPPEFVGPPALEGYARAHFTRWGWRTEIPRDRFARIGKWGETGIQGIGPNGRILCLCGCGREVPVSKRHTTKFRPGCWEEWAKVHDASTVRRHVWKRDKGVCAECRVDTEALKRETAAKLGEDVRRNWDGNFYFVGFSRAARRAHHIPPGFPDVDRAWWEADHRVPVIEGGGLCSLEGMRTLCIPCHKKATAALAARRAAARVPPSAECQLQLS